MSSATDEQDQVLKELSLLLNTMTSIEEVLEDIDRLTSPQQPTSVYAKQRKLLEELRAWKDVQIDQQNRPE